MYYQVNILSQESVTFPTENEYTNIYRALRGLFEQAGIEAYELVEKYIVNAFEAETLEVFRQNLQAFAGRATPEELAQLVKLLTDDNWNNLQASPTKIDAQNMEDAGTYWCLNNIIAEVLPNYTSTIEVLSIKVEVKGNGEDALYTEDDTGKYGEIYPFALRLLMDANADEGEIGAYNLTGPIVTYFEGRKETGQTAVASDEPYDFDVYVNDAYGIAVAVEVLAAPEDNEDGEEWASYEILVHPDWLEGELKTSFQTYSYSDYE